MTVDRLLLESHTYPGSFRALAEMLCALLQAIYIYVPSSSVLAEGATGCGIGRVRRAPAVLFSFGQAPRARVLIGAVTGSEGQGRACRRLPRTLGSSCNWSWDRPTLGSATVACTLLAAAVLAIPRRAPQTRTRTTRTGRRVVVVQTPCWELDPHPASDAPSRRVVPFQIFAVRLQRADEPPCAHLDAISS